MRKLSLATPPPESLPWVYKIEDALERWRVRYALTPAEVRVLRDAVHGADTAVLATSHRIAKVTVKRHVRNLLGKTDDRRLSEAVRRFLYEIVVSDDGTAESGTFKKAT